MGSVSGEQQSSCIVVGGGIVGLATAWMLLTSRPWVKVIVLEKESDVCTHQSGRNSGVIHTGVYYKPGSLKSRMAKAGHGSMIEFCQQYGINYNLCGKIIVATDQSELPNLDNLYQRAQLNGLSVSRYSGAELREVEPNVAAIDGIHLKNAGIIDYRAVCYKLRDLIVKAGGEVRLSQPVQSLREEAGQVVVETVSDRFTATTCVVCGGLQGDRLARLSGLDPKLRIVPFKGEYYELVPERSNLVNGLIYPVPDPRFPFLGVHLTKMISGGVHAGPNAVLSLKREGYSKFAIDWQDTLDIVSFKGFWKFAIRHYRTAYEEMVRSFSRARFTASLQRLVPAITSSDLQVAPCGIRAQSLGYDGNLVDDFRIFRVGQIVHVCNAPSPAATASLEIGRYIVGEIAELLPKPTLVVGSN
jgi:L-2-hydroxyglutarate oxidase